MCVCPDCKNLVLTLCYEEINFRIENKRLMLTNTLLKCVGKALRSLLKKIVATLKSRRIKKCDCFSYLYAYNE